MLSSSTLGLVVSTVPCRFLKPVFKLRPHFEGILLQTQQLWSCPTAVPQKVRLANQKDHQICLASVGKWSAKDVADLIFRYRLKRLWLPTVTVLPSKATKETLESPIIHSSTLRPAFEEDSQRQICWWDLYPEEINWLAFVGLGYKLYPCHVPKPQPDTTAENVMSGMWDWGLSTMAYSWQKWSWPFRLERQTLAGIIWVLNQIHHYMYVLGPASAL